MKFVAILVCFVLAQAAANNENEVQTRLSTQNKMMYQQPYGMGMQGMYSQMYPQYGGMGMMGMYPQQQYGMGMGMYPQQQYYQQPYGMGINCRDGNQETDDATATRSEDGVENQNDEEDLQKLFDNSYESLKKMQNSADEETQESEQKAMKTSQEARKELSDGYQESLQALGSMAREIPEGVRNVALYQQCIWTMQQTLRQNAEANVRSTVDCLNTADEEHMRVLAGNKQEQSSAFTGVFQQLQRQARDINTCLYNNQGSCEGETANLRQLPSDSATTLNDILGSLSDAEDTHNHEVEICQTQFDAVQEAVKQQQAAALQQCQLQRY